MLKLNPDPQFTADIQLTEPGKQDPATVKITFRYKNRDEVVDFGERVKGIPVDQALQEIIVDWQGIDADCTPENIKVLCGNYMQAGLEILTGYYKELSISRVKN